MRKKFVLLGLAVIALTVILLPFAGKGVVSGMFRGGQNYTILAAPGGYSYANITLASNSTAATYVIANATTDIYALNASEFSAFASYSSNALAVSAWRAENANSVEGAEIFTGTSNAIALLSNPIRAPRAKNYYVVIDSTQGSPSYGMAVTAVAEVVYLSPSAGRNILILGAVSIASVIAGIALLLYGVLKKDPAAAALKSPEQEIKDKQYVDELYSGVGKGPVTRRRKHKRKS